MSLFGCDHRWVEVGRTYTDGAARVKGADPETAERLLLGVTNIEQRCEVCGKIAVSSFAGKVGTDADGSRAT